MKIKLLLTIIVCATITACGLKQSKADTVYHNLQYYDVHTGKTLPGAIAISNKKIIAVGPEREVMNAYRANEVIDLEGGICYPGLIDAHSHLTGYAKSFLSVNLNGIKTKEECLKAIADFNNANPDTKWVTGRGWDHSLWDNKYPTKEDLDALNIDKPIYLKRVDGHSAWLNTKAIELVNPKEVESKEGYVALKDKDQYIGIFQETFLKYIDKLVPELSKEETIEALIRAEQMIFASGLTAVTDAGLYKKDIEILNEAYETGKLSIPVYVMANPDSITLDWLETKPTLNSKISLYSVKLYADGSLGSRSACLKHPYHDDASNFGVMTSNKTLIDALTERCLKNNWQLNTHCIGDSANSVMLQAYGRRLQGSNDLRWRIEHAQVVEKSDLDMFTTFNIIPSVQPTHATSDMRWAEARLSGDRIVTAYNYKALIACNGIIALGTDFPVEDISPIKTYYSSVYRQQPFTNNPTNGFLKESALDSDETIKGMTLFAALANRWEDKFGALDTGLVANITVLSQKLNAETWSNPTPTVTIVDGKIVYER